MKTATPPLHERVYAALASASGMGETPPIGTVLGPDVLTVLTDAVTHELAPWDYGNDQEES
jgi:hypothetical protein